MQIIVKTHHVETTQALKEYAEKKCDKLEHFFDHINSITLGLNVESVASEEERHIASAVIHLNGSIITAKETSGSMYSSVDLLVDKCAKQLKKYKEKLRSHKGMSIKQTFYDQDDSAQSKSSNQVTREPYIKKPMGVEDALTIIQDEKLPLLVFHNLKERVCVIYPENGHYNVIET